MTDTHGRPTVFLHIGAMKTGTTFLQQLMFANKAALAEAGLTVPGRSWGTQVRGVQGILRLDRRDRYLRALNKDRWPALVAECLAAPSHASVISMEFLSLARRRGVNRVLDSLDAADVHVIVTVREMTTALPALWQTLVHNGVTFGWDELMDSVIDWKPRTPAMPARRRPSDSFRRTQDVPGILDRWTARLGPDRLHVVTVPPAGSPPDLLWQRFAEVVGVDPAAATQQPADTNASIGLASTELVRHLNQHVHGLSQSEYQRIVKRLALDVLSTRAHLEDRAKLTPQAYYAALRWNAVVRDDLVARGAHVVGSLDDLPVSSQAKARAALPTTASSPSQDEVIDAATAAATGLDQHIATMCRRLRKRGVEAVAQERPSAQARRLAWHSASHPVEAAASDLAEQIAEAATLLRQVRALPGHGR